MLAVLCESNIKIWISDLDQELECPIYCIAGSPRCEGLRTLLLREAVPLSVEDFHSVCCSAGS
jgi:hypothetical protein